MVTIGHLRVTMGHLRLTIGTVVHIRVTLGHLRVTRLFFSISKHEANTNELHPKVRQTCFNYTFTFSKKVSRSRGTVNVSNILHRRGYSPDYDV